MLRMDVLEASMKLKSMLEAHEKAVKKIQSLETSIDRLTKTLVLGNACNHVRNGHLVIQRRCILLGLREMYIVYRTRKWREFTTYVGLLTAILDPENESHLRWNDPGPHPSNSHEVTDNARVFSIDFCEMNRGL